MKGFMKNFTKEKHNKIMQLASDVSLRIMTETKFGLLMNFVLKNIAK